jgi:probable rRNA maturation factor
MAALEVDVQLACEAPGIPPAVDVQSWIRIAIEHSGVTVGDVIEVAVRIIDADEMRTLNRLYREQDKPTNVLSFPAGEIAGMPDTASRLLGDVVICAPVVAAEAEQQGKSLADHWGHMLVHGTLHLLGFDHETDAEALEMERLETRILAAENVTDPYGGS